MSIDEKLDKVITEYLVWLEENVFYTEKVIDVDVTIDRRKKFMLDIKQAIIEELPEEKDLSIALTLAVENVMTGFNDCLKMTKQILGKK